MTEEHVVAKAADLPVGTHLVVEVNGRQIGVFNIAGAYYAIPNICFHQNGPLCRGITRGTLVANAESDWKPTWAYEGEIITCPWHSLEFNVKTGQCLAYPNRRVPTYPIRVDAGDLKLTLKRA